MADLGDDELKKLQKDAERRLMEMHRKSEAAINGSAPRFPDFVAVDHNTEKPHESPKSGTNTQSERHTAGILDFIKLDKIKFDKDTSLIITLILLLSSEKADELLILALLYIML